MACFCGFVADSIVHTFSFISRLLDRQAFTVNTHKVRSPSQAMLHSATTSVISSPSYDRKKAERAGTQDRLLSPVREAAKNVGKTFISGLFKNDAFITMVDTFLDSLQDNTEHLSTHIYLNDNYKPITEEHCAVTAKLIEGSIPEGLSGVFIRNGPNVSQCLSKFQIHHNHVSSGVSCTSNHASRFQSTWEKRDVIGSMDTARFIPYESSRMGNYFTAIASFPRHGIE